MKSKGNASCCRSGIELVVLNSPDIARQAWERMSIIELFEISSPKYPHRKMKIWWHSEADIGHYKGVEEPISTQGKVKERCMSLILLGLLVVVLDVIALFNILFSSMSVPGKLLWALIVLLLPVVGMLLYFAVGQKA
jgi:hypothetical protein